ncbi:hypothetical protein ACFL1I_03630 [Candidatus Omnitrophota bacterium]
MNSFKVGIIALFLSLSAIFFARLSAQDDGLKAYYPLSEGSTWGYQMSDGDEFVMETIEVGPREALGNIDAIKLISHIGGRLSGYKYVTRDLEGVKLYKEVELPDQTYTVITPAEIIIPFDLSSNEKYKNTYSGYDAEGNLFSDGQGTVELKFEGRENVLVPAGNFSDCLKIIKLKSWQGNNGNFYEAKSIIWFAKGVGRVKETKEEIGYSAEEGTTYTDIKKCELSKAVVNGVSIE